MKASASAALPAFTPADVRAMEQRWCRRCREDERTREPKPAWIEGCVILVGAWHGACQGGQAPEEWHEGECSAFRPDSAALPGTGADTATLSLFPEEV